VERERAWPSRSAKLMLKTALANLARHYGIVAPVQYHRDAQSGRVSQWGTQDYKPAL